MIAGTNNSWSVVKPDLWTCVDSPARFSPEGWADPRILKLVPAAHGRGKNGVLARESPNVLFFKRGTRFNLESFLDQDVVDWGSEARETDSLGIKGKRSVMMAALHLLYYLGFRTVNLLGCDFRMDQEKPYAFDERGSPRSTKHNNTLYKCLAARFTALRPHFEERGFRVYNCNPISHLHSFEFRSLDDALALCDPVVPFTTRGLYHPETPKSPNGRGTPS